MPAEDAREAFRRMLHRHHVEKRDLFVNNWFDVRNLRVSATGILHAIYERRPEVYAVITERERPAPKDAEVSGMMAAVSAAYASALDDRGILQPSAELERLISATERDSDVINSLQAGGGTPMVAALQFAKPVHAGPPRPAVAGAG